MTTTYPSAGSQSVGGNFAQTGDRNVGRDLIINEGFRINTRMRPGARATLWAGLATSLSGMATVLSYSIVVYLRINSALIAGTDPQLPPGVLWVPAGYALAFVGVVLLVIALAVPRERTVTPLSWSR